MLKTIKNVDEESWHRFKMLALRHRMAMGQLLQKMIKEYEAKAKMTWKEILEGEKILSDKEAESLLEHTSKLRKEYGFRT